MVGDIFRPPISKINNFHLSAGDYIKSPHPNQPPRILVYYRLVAEKEEIRREMRMRRKALAPEERERASKAICGKLAADEAVGRALAASGEPRAIAVYLASRDEIDLSDFIRDMLRRGAAVVSPRWNGRTYELAKVNGLSEPDLRRGPMGILEPAEADIAQPGEVAAWIVPGLAFTPDGKRLGYGGGWYDRMLAAAGKGSVKIGVAHGFQIVPDIPTEPHDVRLDRIVADDGFRATPR